MRILLCGEEGFEVGAVVAAGEALGELLELRRSDQAFLVSNFFDAADLDALMLLGGLHIGASLLERFMRSSIKPGKASIEKA